jgi:MoCo/4Fe-4S cofactor protein with predicted Tat translocation signal
MSKKYWQSFGELNNSEANQKLVQNEFQEDLLPIEELRSESVLDAKTPRRDFLKYLGFSTAAAAVAASCEMPVKKAIPYVNKPDNLTPGVADFYATTYVQDGDVVSVLAKVRDGRPIKIEGNELSSITGGGTSARVQASVLDLYDTARLRFPLADGQEVSTFEAFDKMVTDALSGLNGAPVVLLTSTVTSPSTKEVISAFLAKYPGSRHVTYDAVSYSGMLLANEQSYGKKAIPSYQFDKAKVVVSLGADFMGSWLNPVAFSKQFATGRKITADNLEMNKHFHFESFLSMTGANADERYVHRPSETGRVAAALLSTVKGQGAVGISDANLKAGIEKAAAELIANRGAGLVVSGSNDVNVQVIVNAINDAIGSNGTTINWGVTVNYRQGIDADMVKLVEDMNAGAVGALLIHGANPAYDYFDAEKFKTGLSKVGVTVSFNPKMDETTELCKYVIPDHHFLESWGDAEPESGYYSFMQPTIAPLFKTRQWQDSLLKWSAQSDTDYLSFLKNYWSRKLGSQDGWNKALQDGVVEPANRPVAGASFNGNLAAALDAVNSAKVSSGIELALYQKVAIGEGKQANNPWLQELPDPVTKATWDNYVIMSWSMAKEMLGIDLTNSGQADKYEVNPPKPVVTVSFNNKSVSLPVLIIPGCHPQTIAIAVGYGRSAKIGKAAENVGQNVYGFADFNGATVQYQVADVEVSVVKGKTHPVALTQTHNTYEDRKEVVRETSLATLKHNPSYFTADREHLIATYAPKTGDFRNEATLYDPSLNERPGIHWGMSIDLNSCNGCGACVVACNAENNIPVVGKAEVLRGHEMHWLRIDRYYVSDKDNPDQLKDVVFQPMLCQHCDNAPCENVCPVAATMHSSEGINQMVYNRCIGTRYCANNCPYKVRRFNWADYMGADSFGNNQDILEDSVLMMNDDLTRMVLNPDVTVRSRGVMEKCSFCAQRLQHAKLEAKKENRVMADGEATVACAQACASGCIVFGDVNDKNSLVYKTRSESSNRLFFVLEQLHTLPNVSYLAKVRNTDELEMAEAHDHEGHGH